MYATLMTSAGVMSMVALGGLHAGFQNDTNVRAHGRMGHRMTVETDANASASAGTSVSSASTSSSTSSASSVSSSSSAPSSSSGSRMTHRDWVRAHIQAIRRCQLLHGREQGRCIKKVNADIRLGVQAQMNGNVIVR